MPLPHFRTRLVSEALLMPPAVPMPCLFSGSAVPTPWQAISQTPKRRTTSSSRSGRTPTPTCPSSPRQRRNTLSSSHMRALVLESTGAPFTLTEVPRPTVARGQELVRIKASGVNPLDTKIRAGKAAHARVELPAILGMDMAGGGGGPVALQLAHALGAQVFATVSADKKKIVEGYGATAIDYRTMTVEAYV